MPDRRGDPGHGDDLARWVDEARVIEAADARSRRQWLRRQLEAEATFRGVLVDLGQRRDTVTLTTTAGSTHAGTVEVVGADYVEVVGATSTVLVPLAGIETVGTAGRGPAGSGHRPSADAKRMADALGDLAADHRPVVASTSRTTVEGRLLAVGQDLLTIAVTGASPATVYVSLSSLAAVGLLGSG